MKRQWNAVAIAAAAVVGAASLGARAQEPTLYSKVGMTVELGGGVVGFTNTNASDVTKTGGSWTARLGIGTRSHLGAEAAYLGTAQAMSTLGVSDNAYLLSNGVEGNLRFNALTGALQPYAVVGVAWRHFSLQNTSFNTSDVQSSDNIAEVPVGLGIAYRYGGFVADLRLSLRNAFQSTLIANTPLSSWDAGARLGFEF